MNFQHNVSDQYNKIARQYELTDEAIAKKYSFGPSFIRLCKQAPGRRMIDVACGSGYGTRFLAKNCFPKNLMGLDVSLKMITLACSHEKESPLGIIYLLGDVIDFNFSSVKPVDIINLFFPMPSPKKNYY